MRWQGWLVLGIAVVIVVTVSKQNDGATERREWLDAQAQWTDDSASRAWQYRTGQDRMRGSVIYTGEIEAQGDPINAPRLIIQRTGSRYDIAIRASMKSGVYEFPGCITAPRRHLIVKFDDRPIREITCQQGVDTLLPASILADIKASRQMMIEMSAGGHRVQYTFKTVGLII